MNENIRITIPLDIYNILKSDKSYFNLDSMNELYIKVIKNYYQHFPINRERINRIRNILKNKIHNKDLQSIIKDIAEIDIKPTRLCRGAKTERLSLKVTNDTKKIIISLNKLVEEYDFPSLVSMLREIFISYAKLRLLEKENIVLKQEIFSIEYAISKKFETQINYRGKKIDINPYLIVVPVDDFSRYLIAEHINDGKLKILKLSDIKIVLVDEYRVFSITPSIENTLKDYRTNKTSVFNSETAKLIKKNLELNNFDCVFPYLIDEARNFTEDKIDLTSTIKS